MKCPSIALAIVVMVIASGCGEKRTTEPSARERPGVDNSRMNTRDKDGALPTPTDQKNNDADLKRTADIRKRVVEAKLSVNATNVKIITQNGRVTLRGPVDGQHEKDTIDAIAREVAGDANVENLIDVAQAR